MTPLRLGYIDFAFLSPARPVARKALQDCVEIAEHLDALGFARYWVGEHHTADSAFSSPELLVPVLAGCTTNIRVGVGAVLLRYRSAYKVAADFRLSEALFPGRIDLGVGRGGADDRRAHEALIDGRPNGEYGLMDPKEYAAKVEMVAQFLNGSVPADHPAHGVTVNPEISGSPDLWVCGAGSAGAIAAKSGASFCLTLFHGAVPNGPGLFADYRAAFVPCKTLAAPRAGIAVAGACAATDEAAEAIRAAWPSKFYKPTIVGTPETWKREVDRLRRDYATDDLFYLDIAATMEQRQVGAELLAKALLGS